MADHIMQYFTYGHLPDKAQHASKPFCELARWIETNIPRNPERTAALRRLLESKDAAVRAALAATSTSTPPAATAAAAATTAADGGNPATRPTDPAGNPTQE